MNLILRYFTAGESHGKALIGMIEGFPSNVHISIDNINNQLKIRQSGYGRGDRMKIESDYIEFLSGIRNSKTIGSPITFIIRNKDYENWKNFMDPVCCDVDSRKVTCPRPGHADLTGVIKYNLSDIRDVLERSSARETATRVALGAIFREFLNIFNIEIRSYVFRIGEICDENKYGFDEIIHTQDSKLRCLDKEIEKKMINTIDKVKNSGDSLGGGYEIRVKNVPIGLGSYTHYDRKLDGIIAGELMSINSVKAVEFGDGIELSKRTGSTCHDQIFYEFGTYRRSTNYAGGIEGGMSNGEEIIIRCYHKPIPTLYKPLKSVNIESKESFDASVERSDVVVVPAASIVSENVVASVITKVFLEKFSGDSLEEVVRNWKNSN